MQRSPSAHREKGNKENCSRKQKGGKKERYGEKEQSKSFEEKEMNGLRRRNKKGSQRYL